MERADAKLDWATLRARLQPLSGQRFWRSLEELADEPDFQELVEREFPAATKLAPGPTRRQFLALMGASLGLAGLTGCTPAPRDLILPYVRQPEEVLPGRPLFFATAMPMAGRSLGLLAESHLGRPTKIEGNPDHPASLGATDVFAQASILTLYDPERAKGLTYLSRPATWANLFDVLRQVRARQLKAGTGSLRILTETVTSPTLARQLDELLAEFPRAQWHAYEPGNLDRVHAGARLAFKDPVNTVYHFDKAKVVVSLDADFLAGQVRYTRDYAARRRQRDDMNRLYAVTCTASNTGKLADHHLPLQARRMEGFARSLAGELARQRKAQKFQGGDEEAWQILAEQGTAASKDDWGEQAPWLQALARDLTGPERVGQSIIIVGNEQPAVVHALAHAMNHALGNVARTVTYTAPLESRPVDQLASLKALADAMNAGEVDTLLILGGNPVYTAPADLDFTAAMQRVPLRIGLGLFPDETAPLCHYHVPATHYLEMWSDVRSYDGTAAVVQPLINPLYTSSKSPHELMAALSAHPERSGLELVRSFWRAQRGSESATDFEKYWMRSLQSGVLDGSKLPDVKPTMNTNWPKAEVSAPAGDQLELVFRLDPAMHDGRFASNGWLQEWPRPLTRLTWGNAALISPRTAERFQLNTVLGYKGGEHGQAYADTVTLQLEGRDPLTVPVWIVPGMPDDSVTVNFGYGRTRAGKIGTGVGFDAYRLRHSDAPWLEVGVELTPTGDRYQLASIQQHHLMNGRDLVRTGTPDHLPHAHGAHGEAVPERIPLTLYPAHPYEGYKWAMAIDLTSCVGCGACVMACQAENNIPVVGKKEVLRGREMHWLRVDLYYEGELDNPAGYFQPVPCMQCENAPCELVCPVEATVHSDEGLNDMVYNRCVGTRYCSNNCPYKVRRFNFLEYADYATESLKLLRNPEVTVRTRGVMEKCTYCTQRISMARIDAEKQGRQVRDGDLLTACQAACPAQAITFGNANDEKSNVSKLRRDPLHYSLLEELNTRPRTTYLAALRNPNKELED
ncbi:MAG: TAT-variant-translocated molybdopterin oxidoreductase [Gemmataceae bacterium]